MFNPPADNEPAVHAPARLEASRARILEKCNECQACVQQCAFLDKHGSPRTLAAALDPGEASTLDAAFECSLCGLCTVLCPKGCDPAGLFLDMRRQSNALAGDLGQHGRILNYERRGSSPLFSWAGLPQGCRTVFFPGCNLPGSRPETTKKLFMHLQQSAPDIGIVLDCCCKPSHDLGRTDFFESRFHELRRRLEDHGVRKVLCACPNCFKVFQTHGRKLQAEMVYTHLDRTGLPESPAASGAVRLHDPCPLREDAAIHGAVRNTLRAKGVDIHPMKHEKRKTLCCGEGGAAAAVAPGLANQWTQQRAREAEGETLLTYCAGCAGYLNRETPTHHVLDFYFAPEQTLAGKARVARSPMTYWNRLRIKRWFQDHLDASVSWKRAPEAPPGRGGRAKLWMGAAFLILIAGFMVWARTSGFIQHFEAERLQQAIASAGVWAPLAYVLFYTIAPTLLLPSLPITLAAGILFGPAWGVLYSVAGATSGACVAFLFSRYIARDWVQARLSAPRWRRLDGAVEEQGWKVVAFMRIVPMFSYNLINYAFGVTSVRFSHYAAATLAGMLPVYTIYILFSHSFLELLRGRVSLEFLAAGALILALCILPLLAVQWRAGARGNGLFRRRPPT